MFPKLKARVAGIVAVMVGLPMAEQAQAQVGGIVFSVFDLIFSISNVAGDS